MKLLRKTLSLSLTAALVALSPGSCAWAQFSEAAGIRVAVPAAPAGSAGASGAAVSMTASSVRLLSLTPTISAPFSSLEAAPAAQVPNAAVPTHVLAEAVVAAEAVAAPGASQAEPAVTALEGVRRELPDFSRMSGGESKDAAGQDFMARVGEKHRAAPALSVFSAALSGMSRTFLAKSSKGSRMPDSGDKHDGTGGVVGEDGGIDEIGNPRRTGGEGGPDDATDPDAGRGGSDLFAVMAAVGAAAVSGASVFAPILILPMVVVSVVLHEIGHAKAAARLGDPTATLEGRASFNPLTWHRHVDRYGTIIVPAAIFALTGRFFGWAKPVPINDAYFKNPVKDMAKVAAAGPAMNLILAGAGALAYAGAVAGGLGAAWLGALVSFVLLNSVLAVLNLIPIKPLDGGNIIAAFLPRTVSEALDSFYARLGAFGMVAVMAMIMLGSGLIVSIAMGVAKFFIGVSLGVTGVQLAGAALPAVAALGLLMGQPKPGAVPAVVPAASEATRPVDLVVRFSAAKTLTRDLHLSDVDASQPSYTLAYQGVYQALLKELSAVGLDPETLAAYDASPVASYQRINAATFRVDATKAADFESMLRAAGHRVDGNDRRKIITPVPIKPEDMDPTARGAISMEENLEITKASKVHAIAEKRWGKPDLNPWQRLWRKLRHPFTKDEPAQPKTAVVDSGADVSHPLLKRVKEVKNATSGENVDDIGHGTWVTSQGLNYAPWAKNVTHYKTFVGGGATLDDILRALTMAANDGNLVISNSWGSDDGDPNSPDSELVRKLAEEGHIMVFAAGNAGPMKNTIGSPAIVTYKDPTTGAIRVIAVAAADRNEKVAGFSSRGPGSYKTKGIPGYPHRPNMMSLGYNTDGAWPAGLGDADRTDPEKGAMKAISGTSMSTPSVWGALTLLLMMFGVTEKGARLDAVVNAFMASVEKTGKNGPDDEGEGFMNVEAAHSKLLATLGDPLTGNIPPAVLERYRSLKPETSFTVTEGMPLEFRKVGDPRMAERRSEARRLETKYPGIAYWAEGALGRLWMRLTGRGPKAS